MSRKKRYVFLQVLVYFALFFIACIALFSLFQLIGDFSSFLRKGSLFSWRLFFAEIPSVVRTITPLITVLTILFVMGTMERNRELRIFEINGIRSLEIYSVCIFFSLCTTLLAFVAGNISFSPSFPLGKKSSSLAFATDRMVVWAERHHSRERLEEVMLVMLDPQGTRVYFAPSAKIEGDTLILSAGTVRSIEDRNDPEHYFEETRVEFPVNLGKAFSWFVSDPEQTPFFTLYAALKNLSRVGIVPRREWITLWEKVSYPLLNFFLALLLLPFLNIRKKLSRSYTIVAGFSLSLLAYLSFQMGISLGKNSMIPWWAAPWLFHIVAALLSLLYLSKKEKLDIIPSTVRPNKKR